MSGTLNRYGRLAASLSLLAVGALFASALQCAGAAPAGQQATLAPDGGQPNATGSSAPQQVPTPEHLNAAFTRIAQRATPWVVSIQAERIPQPGLQRQQRRDVPPEFDEWLRRLDPRAPVPVQASGSGVIVSTDGYILTNNHVVADFDRLHVKLTDQRTFGARVIGRDPTTDVALLRIDARDLPAATLGTDETLQIGEWVLAIGNPLGLDFTVTAGIVSALGRGGADMQSPNDAQYAVADFIQTDAAINPGNSGGPLVDISGKVIGINAMIASPTGFYSGYGFAIPIDIARRVMEDLIAEGRVRRPMLGVQVAPVTPEDATVAGLSEIAGAKVGGFSAGAESPARQAGLEPGDIVVSVDGKAIDRVSTLQRVIRLHRPGHVVTIDAMRFGQRKSFRVRLGEVLDSAVTPMAKPAGLTRPDGAGGRLGMMVEPIEVDAARTLRIAEEHYGVHVVAVTPGGPAAGRLTPSDVVVAQLYPERRRVRTAADWKKAAGQLDARGYITLLVYNVASRATRVETLRVGGH